MSILDSILGGGGGNDSEQNNVSMTETSREFAANPNFQLGVSDILHSWNESRDDGNMESDASTFTSIGDIGLSFSVPIYASENSSSVDYSSSQDGGGLLSGLL